MKRIFFGAAIVCALAACHQPETYKDQSAVNLAAQSTTALAVQSADPAIAGQAPVMKFDADSYNFGKINQGDSVVHEFKFTNIGKTPLIITDATATCGCTKPEWPKGPIQPNASGIVKVTFHSVGKQGLQDKMVTITGNTVPTTTMVHLVGEVTTK